MTVQDWVGQWTLDPDRTQVTFRSPTFWGLAKVKGTFTKTTGAGQATAPDVVSGHLELDVASVSTGIRKRDEHLRSADFFDVDAFPTIELEVESAAVTGPGTVELRAQLKIKGVQRPLNLVAEVTALDDGAVRLTTTTTLNRREFGVDGNMLGMMGDTTTAEAAAVFVKQS